MLVERLESARTSSWSRLTLILSTTLLFLSVNNGTCFSPMEIPFNLVILKDTLFTPRDIQFVFSLLLSPCFSYCYSFPCFLIHSSFISCPCFRGFIYRRVFSCFPCVFLSYLFIACLHVLCNWRCSLLRRYNLHA